MGTRKAKPEELPKKQLGRKLRKRPSWRDWLPKKLLLLRSAADEKKVEEREADLEQKADRTGEALIRI